jgi:hypothetical protein
LEFKVAARGKLDKAEAGLETDAAFLLVPSIRRLGGFWIKRKNMIIVLCAHSCSQIIMVSE